MKNPVFSEFSFTILCAAIIGFGCASERIADNNEQALQKPEESKKIPDPKESSVQKQVDQEINPTDSSNNEGPVDVQVDSNLIQTETNSPVNENPKEIVLDEFAEEELEDSNSLTYGEANKDTEPIYDKESNESSPFLSTENNAVSSHPVLGKEGIKESEIPGNSELGTESSDRTENEGLAKKMRPNKEINDDEQNFTSDESSTDYVSSANTSNEENMKLSEKSLDESFSEKGRNQNTVLSNSEIKNGNIPSLVVEQDKNQRNHLNQNGELDPTIGLKDVFEEEANVASGKDLSIALSPNFKQSKEKKSSSGLSLGFRDLPNDNNDELSISRKLVLGNEVGENLSESISDPKVVVTGDSSNNRLTTKESSAERLKLGFTDQSSRGISQSATGLTQEVGFGDSIQQKIDEASTSIKNPRLPNSRKSKVYGNVRDFLSVRNQSGKNLSSNESVRNYNRLRDWGSDDKDNNRSQIQYSQPKQFNRAVEWIRQKGRVKED